MFHSRRAIVAFLGLIMAVATLLGGCQAADAIKVPLVTTAIPDNTNYTSLSYVLNGGDFPQFRLDEKNPTKKYTFGGIECSVTAQLPAKIPDDGSVPGKVLFKTPTQEFTLDLGIGTKVEPVELTLENGRKYPLTYWGGCYTYTTYNNSGSKTGKIVETSGGFRPASVQTGKIGPPPQSTIALYDSNLDGFYTTDKDGIVIDMSSETYSFVKGMSSIVQPLSKYISVSGSILEIQNLAKDGSKLTLLPYRGATASLEVIAPPKYEGQIVLTSDTGLNVTVSGKAKGGKGETLTVVPGNYTVLAAKFLPEPDTPLWQGRSIRVTGAGMPALKVQAGAKQVLTLSGPRIVEFQAALVDGKISIKPETFHIKGQAGETYLDVFNFDHLPEVYLNVDGQSIFLGKMPYG
ncbi:MAG: hypothetical protein FWD61_12580 [Phycisphaerales bacterium]|nr:hypothetical protein [Phycisphaerales bacterium]